MSVDLVRGSVLFEGLDLVDGTPVLDIKPFVPFCDSVPEPRAPYWCEGAMGRPGTVRRARKSARETGHRPHAPVSQQGGAGCRGA